MNRSTTIIISKSMKHLTASFLRTYCVLPFGNWSKS